MSKPKRRTYTREFKMDAVGLVTNQGYTFKQAAESLGVHVTRLRDWKKQLEAEGVEAFPGKGRLKPADEEIRCLREQVRRLKMERDILKKVAPSKAWERGMLHATMN